MSVVGFLAIIVILAVCVVAGIVIYMAGANDPRGEANVQGVIGVALVLWGLVLMVYTVVYYFSHL